MTGIDFKTVDIEVVKAEGFRVWHDTRRLDIPHSSTARGNFLSVPDVVKALLRGHLMDIYSQVDDSSTLRVLKRIQDPTAQCFPAFEHLQREAERVWHHARGVMSSSVMDYVRGPFVESLRSICETFGWSVENKACCQRFVDAVCAFHSDSNHGDGDGLGWLASAVNTPCLVVNKRTKHLSNEERMKSSFDGADPERICKSDVNIFDLFQVVACSGHVVFLRAKNNNSMCLVPSLVVDGSRRYMFEISGMFEFVTAKPTNSVLGLLCLSNGIVCDPLGRCLRSSNNQGLICEGKISITLAGVASRFRVSYSMVSEFIQGTKTGRYALSVDHCSIDNSSNPPHNFRVADMSAQNLNRAGDYFTWQYLDDMGEADKNRITAMFRTAQQRGEVYRLYSPTNGRKIASDDMREQGHVYRQNCKVCVQYIENSAPVGDHVYRRCSCAEGSHTSGDVIPSPNASDVSIYQEMNPVGEAWNSIWYFESSDDTVLLKYGADPNRMDPDIDICDLPMISVLWYVSHGICDVSNLAEQQRYQRMTVYGVEFQVSRSIGFSNALHRRDNGTQIIISGDGVKYAKVNDGGNHLVVHHKNSKPIENFGWNLEIIKQSENSRFGAQRDADMGRVFGLHAASLILGKSGVVGWSPTRPDASIQVKSIQEVVEHRRTSTIFGKDVSYTLSISDLVGRYKDENMLKKAPEKFHFRMEMYPKTKTVQYHMSIEELHVFLQRANVKTSMATLRTLKREGNLIAKGIDFDTLLIERLDSDDTVVRRMILKRKIDATKGFHIEGIN